MNQEQENISPTKDVINAVKRSSPRLKGVVVSDVQDKTVVVRVDRQKVHRKYHKRYTRSKRYQVHDEKNECHEGDWVEFGQCAPKSRTKKWRIIRKIKD